MKHLATLLLGLLTGIGGTCVWAGKAGLPAAVAAEARPPRVPIVAVGSRIAWNLAYVPGALAQQTLDVYAPADAHEAPVVIYVHRGEWARGDKSEVSYKPKLLNEQGIVLVSVNYRLSDVARHPAQVDDVAAAVRWTYDHIAEYGGSAARIVLMGHSAGCHIASMVGLDPRPLAKVGLTPAVLCGVVCWSGGAYDLPAKLAEGGMYKPYIEKNFGAGREALDDASPIRHVREVRPSGHFLFVSAGEGKAASRELSERMAREIEAAGGRAQARTLEGKSHYSADYDCGRPEDPLDSGRVLLDFIGKVATREPN
ncbi:MAG: alpha/beta hydrolase [Planctomycetes bacterium]|nr:alpha/beta hydrolase [Planctomycetota bacterium]